MYQTIKNTTLPFIKIHITVQSNDVLARLNNLAVGKKESQRVNFQIRKVNKSFYVLEKRAHLMPDKHKPVVFLTGASGFVGRAVLGTRS